MFMRRAFRCTLKDTFVILCATLMIVSMMAGAVFGADISSFKTDSYNATITVRNNNEFDYKESIVVDCTDLQEVQGELVFERFLDSNYKDKVSNVGVNGYEAVYDSLRNCIVITVPELGSNSTLAFELNYTLTGIDYMGQREDDLYLPMLSAWQAEISQAKVKIICPEDMHFASINYISEYGEEAIAIGKWTVDEEHGAIRFQGRELPAGSTVAFDGVLPAGYWANATSVGFPKQISLFILLAGTVALLLLRLIFGKEANMPINKEKYAPKGLSPAHAGYLIDGIVDNPDITSIFFYIAEKGYMVIEEYDRKKFRFIYKHYPKNETKAVRILFDAIFDKSLDNKKNKVVKLCDRKDAIKHATKRIRRNVPKDIFGGRQYFSVGSRLGSILLWCTFFFVVATLPFMNIIFLEQTLNQALRGAVVAIIVSITMCFLIEQVNIAYYGMKRRLVKDGKQRLFIASLAYTIAAICYVYFFRFGYNGRIGDSSVMAVSIFFFAIAPFMVIGMKSRSKKNVYISSKIMGMLDFMQNCTKEQIRVIHNEDKDYYFTLMPYAYAFNMSRKFAGAFEYCEVKGPSWYKPYGIDGDYMFDIVIMNSMIVNLQTELNNLVFNPQD